jgi:hypothetical protein
MVKLVVNFTQQLTSIKPTSKASTLKAALPDVMITLVGQEAVTDVGSILQCIRGYTVTGLTHAPRDTYSILYLDKQNSFTRTHEPVCGF